MNVMTGPPTKDTRSICSRSCCRFQNGIEELQAEQPRNYRNLSKIKFRKKLRRVWDSNRGPLSLRFTVLHSTTELSWFVVKQSSFFLFINSAEITKIVEGANTKSQGFQGLKKIAEQCLLVPSWNMVNKLSYLCVRPSAAKLGMGVH